MDVVSHADMRTADAVMRKGSSGGARCWSEVERRVRPLPTAKFTLGRRPDGLFEASGCLLAQRVHQRRERRARVL